MFINFKYSQARSWFGLIIIWVGFFYTSYVWGSINSDDFRSASLSAQQPGIVRVPNVIGLSLEKARETLADAELRVRRVNRVISDAEPDTVIRQSLEPGDRVDVGTFIDLWIAVREMVEVPYVVGRDIGQAEEIIVNAKLRVGNVEERISERKPGTIIEQNPPADTPVYINSPVNLWIAARRERVEVPNLVGRRKEQAEEILMEAGLQVGELDNKISELESGIVLDQKPSAGTIVPVDTPVNLLLAVREIVEVPNVVRRNINQAREILVEARLQVGESEKRISNLEPGTVVEQNPPAGKMVPVYSRVDLWLASREERREERIVVPNVVGLDIEQARERLAKARLQLGSLNERISNLESGTVLRQDPRAGTRVRRDTRVNLELAKKGTTILPWLGIIGGLLLGLGGGYLLFSRKKRPKKIGGPEELNIQFRPQEDPGTQHIESEISIQPKFEVRLRTVMDQGEQDIEAEGSLIMDERRNHE